ncbi:hypothetical protein GCM10010261_59650 [Streptomyces pilosus]|uniref:hypothetical protein n=1 Tax=Streptomyces pilosus TaxID=28893 RepID=UPI001672B50A|nr:hypothetical protein [Streptomyces pilosus]GGV67076.1 hypothetical protein GCM10010261_59650 [Streptomyces pilosus]
MPERILFYGASKGRGVVAAIDDDNNIGDVTLIPNGSMAKDWTEVTALSGDRILFYGKSKGRGVVAAIDDGNNVGDVRVIPEGSFAKDWTEVSALRPQESRLTAGLAAESRLA